MERVFDSHENAKQIIGEYEQWDMDIHAIVASMKKLVSLLEIVSIMHRYLFSIKYENFITISAN